jgi:benzoyl-CoA reductase/2-hydroxyglutaryl-CoA dehydratase subunit BcrC/BadD/HgdB
MLIDMLRKAGGRIVLDGTDTGERTMPAGFDAHRIQVNPLEELARAYFMHIPDVFRRPNEALFDWLKKEIYSRSVDGMVLLRYVWCDKWHAEVKRLRETFEIPLLDIDLDGADPSGRNATRIQAFIEALK